MSHVYLITTPSAKEEGIFKIGVAKDIGYRIASLQTANHERLITHKVYKVESPRKLEKQFHEQYEEHRVLNEWFRLSHEDVYD